MGDLAKENRNLRVVRDAELIEQLPVNSNFDPCRLSYDSGKIVINMEGDYEEGQEGRNAYQEKREPNFNKFPKRP